MSAADFVVRLQKMENTMCKFRLFGTITLLGEALSGCGGGNNNKALEACVSRDVAYFKEISSYPTLPSAPNAGISAETVARERCNRTTTAFLIYKKEVK